MKIDLPPPAGAKAAGRRLWREVVREFDLAEHELQLLRQAVNVADLCDELRAMVERDGVLPAGSKRIHPALVELRAQRILLARLIVALRVPIGDQETPAKTAPEPRLQRRGTRGIYAINGGRP
jgi:hypothetical protein